MAQVFLGCFIVGFALSLISFLMGFAGHPLGSLGHGAELGHGGDAGHGHGQGADGETGLKGLPLLNFGTITAFLTWFGGIGFLMLAYSRAVLLLTAGIALVGGLIGAGLVFVFMAKVLAPDQIPLRAADYHLPGTLARVTVTVPATGTGEIVYVQGGTRKALAARGVQGEEIARGTEVVVLQYERGIAYVRPWDQMAGPAPGSGRA